MQKSNKSTFYIIGSWSMCTENTLGIAKRFNFLLIWHTLSDGNGYNVLITLKINITKVLAAC